MKIIYTDLDGTFLDHDTYSYENAKPGLNLIKKRKIPLVFCTSKTRSEIEYWRDKINNNHPFISENGGGIFIPKKYFNLVFKYDAENNDYFIVEFGEDIKILKQVLNEIKKEFDIISFLEMSDEKIYELAGLNSEQIKLAKKREYVLPFTIKNKNDEKKILQKIKGKKLNVTVGGRFYHLMGSNSKGRAVRYLTNLYKKEYSKVYTVGIGDSENDFSMLKHVDKGFLVQKQNNGYASDDFYHAEGRGPIGWNNVILNEIK
jgi:mannosyl-3-phosphoglycerate phosphatase